MTAHHTVRLHARDVQLLLSLEEGRVCTARQAGRYLWGHINSANRRLKELEAAGLVHRLIDRYVRETIIRPTPKAIEVLLERGLIAPDELTWSPRLRQQKIGYVMHEIEVNELRFRLEKACHQHSGVLLVSCRSGPQLYDQVTHNGSTHLVRPDRFVELALSSQVSTAVLKACLEVDRGTKPIRTRGRDRRSVVKQLCAYDCYARSFQAKHGSPLCVLVTTPDQTRISSIVQGMLQAASRHGGEVGMRRYYSTFTAAMSDPLGATWIAERSLGRVLTWLAGLPVDQPLAQVLSPYPDVAAHLTARQLSAPYRRSRRQGPPWCDPALRDAVLDALLLCDRLKRHSLLELPGLLPA